MNILFHTATAIATVVLVTNADEFPLRPAQIFRSCLLALLIGVIFHGILDYMPHRYPVNAAIDALMSLLIMLIIIFRANGKLRFIIAASFIGNILPDLIDLSPSILNKYLHLRLPIMPKIFPWHWQQYSGSIYNGSFNVSTSNHFLVLALVLIICLVRYKEFKAAFIRE